MDSANEIIPPATALEWIFRGFGLVGSGASVVFWWLFNGLDNRLKDVETLAHKNQLDIARSESAMLKIQSAITEQVGQSIQRVHDKIEGGNRYTNEQIQTLEEKLDTFKETVINKLDQLRRELQQK